MIAKLLIANRGEIACRIIRTARAMGVATLAVYSEADAAALHVRQADEAVPIGPPSAAESYLRGDAIIAAARAHGADAVHPGYGFLSENADFAQAVIDAGLIWVGPKPASIRAMGLKDAAKAKMIEAGVAVTPGYLGADQSAHRLTQEAKAIGFPVLIKAVAGGGGKGMRKVEAVEDFAAALESCQREARASFGNDEVLLEKWIAAPRHIEVQVFGDCHGNIVHLFERDCSLQRRHQKVIEEAPAPGMDEATRAQICAAAVRAAQAVDYENAGTVEFIADASEGLRADRIFFMEMNTRLQVEHPVTEEITGIDLVEWQLRVASGEAIPLRQGEIAMKGHAIEARLYAEDPAKGFLPSTGKLERLTLCPDARVETGVAEGDTVTPFYDPMIAKIIACGKDRTQALERIQMALQHTAIAPLRTNAGFAHRLLQLPEFVGSALDTGLIDRNLEEIALPGSLIEQLAGDAASAIVTAELHDSLRLQPGTQMGQAPSGHSVWRAAIGFRLNADKRMTVPLYRDNTLHMALLPDNFRQHQPTHSFAPDGSVSVMRNGETLTFSRRAPGTAQSGAADGAILAPMPGKVIALDVAEGDKVREGQRLMVLEAMKMEHALTAPFKGTVTQLSASKGAQAVLEAVLCVVEPD